VAITTGWQITAVHRFVPPNRPNFALQEVRGSRRRVHDMSLSAAKFASAPALHQNKLMHCTHSLGPPVPDLEYDTAPSASITRGTSTWVAAPVGRHSRGCWPGTQPARGEVSGPDSV